MKKEKPIDEIRNLPTPLWPNLGLFFRHDFLILCRRAIRYAIQIGIDLFVCLLCSKSLIQKPLKEAKMRIKTRISFPSRSDMLLAHYIRKWSVFTFLLFFFFFDFESSRLFVQLRFGKTNFHDIVRMVDVTCLSWFWSIACFISLIANPKQNKRVVYRIYKQLGRILVHFSAAPFSYRFGFAP